ncbi:hypothetical protein OMCYN_00033 [cyanobiont of Ornithocercus magnificus]|nr:hypothetical protein OMCYN_00033 [cyanobiont of Ornithocercus magnificus]
MTVDHSLWPFWSSDPHYSKGTVDLKRRLRPPQQLGDHASEAMHLDL